MFRALCAHHQERPNCINTASGNCHSVLVAVSCDGWEQTLQSLSGPTMFFSHDLTNGMVFGKKVIEHKIVF
jgi:hypothetical protein